MRTIAFFLLAIIVVAHGARHGVKSRLQNRIKSKGSDFSEFLFGPQNFVEAVFDESDLQNAAPNVEAVSTTDPKAFSESESVVLNEKHQPHYPALGSLPASPKPFDKFWTSGADPAAASPAAGDAAAAPPASSDGVNLNPDAAAPPVDAAPAAFAEIYSSVGDNSAADFLDAEEPAPVQHEEPAPAPVLMETTSSASARASVESEVDAAAAVEQQGELEGAFEHEEFADEAELDEEQSDEVAAEEADRDLSGNIGSESSLMETQSQVVAPAGFRNVNGHAEPVLPKLPAVPVVLAA